MNNTLTLYVPSSMTTARRVYTERMARRFGGATVTTGYGAWINGEAELEFEDVSMIMSYAEDWDLEGLNVMLRQFVHDLLKAGEEAVMYVLNGKAYIHTEDA